MSSKKPPNREDDEPTSPSRDDGRAIPSQDEPSLSRRRLFRIGGAGLIGGAALTGGAAATHAGFPSPQDPAGEPTDGGSPEPKTYHELTHYDSSTVGAVTGNDFDPLDLLTDFNRGDEVRTLPSGQVERRYEFVAVDKEVEVAPGVFFPAWTYNGRIPGPTIRCDEGDRIRIDFTNAGSHPHTIHFHGIHPAAMDGVFEVVEPGQSFTYEFDAEPYGLHHYHCHAVPLKRHIHKGLYGVFIVDPPGGRPPAREFVMELNGFDTNLDGDNEVYAVNTVAFHYQRHPIVVRRNELVRLYVVNILEFDLLNSIHVHANFFDVYRTGTRLEPDEYTDTLMMCQGERHILELRFPHLGDFMFHAHQSEFAELGWMGFFRVIEEEADLEEARRLSRTGERPGRAYRDESEGPATGSDASGADPSPGDDR